MKFKVTFTENAEIIVEANDETEAYEWALGTCISDLPKTTQVSYDETCEQVSDDEPADITL